VAHEGNVYVNYAVLILAAIFEGTALYFAMREFNKSRGDLGIIEALKKSKDSATAAIIIEDSAALVGLIVAFLGIFFSHLFGEPIFDGIASLIIGVLLSLVAIFLAYESKQLLVGEGLNKEDRLKIKEILSSSTEIERFGLIKSLYFGPKSVLLALDVNFKDGLSTDEIEGTVEGLEKKIQSINPIIDKIYIESRALK